MKYNLSQQTGATLLTSLILLLTLTIIGTTMMRSTQTELQIVRNSQDQTRAFQAAGSMIAHEKSRKDLVPLSAPGWLPNDSANTDRDFIDADGLTLANGSGRTQYTGTGVAAGYTLSGSPKFNAYFFESTATADGSSNTSSTIRSGFYVVAPGAG